MATRQKQQRSEDPLLGKRRGDIAILAMLPRLERKGRKMQPRYLAVCRRNDCNRRIIITRQAFINTKLERMHCGCCSVNGSKPKNRSDKPKDRGIKWEEGTFIQRYLLEYKSWIQMLERCYNPKCVAYEEYGGRGIRVTEEWHSKEKDFSVDPYGVPKGFLKFLECLGPRKSRYYTLDRIDPNGHYEPGNVRWATKKAQGFNKRHQAYIRLPSGELVRAKKYAKEYGLNYSALRERCIKEGTWVVKTE